MSLGFELIIPFIPWAVPLLADESITEIMLIPGPALYIEREGRIQPHDIEWSAEDHDRIRVAAKHIARRLGDEVSESKPILDSRLPDGNRISIIVPPASRGVAMTIRKFPQKRMSLHDLVAAGSLTDSQAGFLTEAVCVKKLNVLISGSTGSGKSTLANALLSEIDPSERLVICEETSELKLSQPHVLYLEAPVLADRVCTLRDLVRASLRHRPDRLVIGEVRSGEAWDLLQALNTGATGSVATIHGNSAKEALDRLAQCAMMAGVGVPYEVVRSTIASTIQVVVHIVRQGKGRAVREVMTCVTTGQTMAPPAPGEALEV
jgi:pilus assembly protein CpaF